MHNNGNECEFYWCFTQHTFLSLLYSLILSALQLKIDGCMLGANVKKNHRRTGVAVVLLHARAHALKEVLQNTTKAAALCCDSIRPHHGARVIDLTTTKLDKYVIHTLQRNISLIILQLKTVSDNITHTGQYSIEMQIACNLRRQKGL